MKPTVYIETSIVSYLTSRPSNDIRVAASQNTTIEWWETRRPIFDLYVSEFVLAEAGFGHPDAANRRMTVLRDIPELETSKMLEFWAWHLLLRVRCRSKQKLTLTISA